MRAKLLYMLLYLCTLPTWGVEIFSRSLNSSTGLPDNYVRYLLQDSCGFIWMGTPGGLYRYDGYFFKTYKHTADQPVRLVIETENADWRADGMDLQYVKVRAVDKKGRVVPTNDYKVTFQVEGPARIIAVDNGDHSSDDLFAGNEKQLYEGFAMAIVRSDRHQAGKVKLTVSSDGLKGASKTVVTK